MEYLREGSVKRDMKSMVSLVAVIILLAGLPVRSWGADELKLMEAKGISAAYCYAGSRVDEQATGGFAPSENVPKKIAAKTSGREGKVSLVALPAERVAFKREYRGFRLLLVNRTKSEAAFGAADSQLSIVQEAKDAQGKWRPIEVLPSRLCGNSYHRVFLPAGHYWEFASPVHSGSMKTKLRFVLLGEKPIYSNEFAGSIDPGQFH
jgi:hypothetical protein